VQPSDSDDYAGGALVVEFAHLCVLMPRDRGTLVAFPGWTVHAVEPVTHGERWALVVNCFGPRLR
jgi:predicted 2-oxoglutarate/Fe(II)-dependent dioxygenase YbiX